MRLDDCLPASSASEEDGPVAAAQPRSSAGGLRFTSNVVGSLYVVTDVICFIAAVPITLGVYSMVRGSRLEPSVHITALVLMLGSFLLIRSSRQAYRRSLLDLSDNSDTTFDAVISSLIASALIWQAGMVEHYSRGITLLFLLTVVLCLSALPAYPSAADHAAGGAWPDRTADCLLWRRSGFGLPHPAVARVAQFSASPLRRHRR